MVEYNKNSFTELINEIYIDRRDSDDVEDEMEYLKFQYEKGILDYNTFL